MSSPRSSDYSVSAFPVEKNGRGPTGALKLGWHLHFDDPALECEYLRYMNGRRNKRQCVWLWCVLLSAVLGHLLLSFWSGRLIWELAIADFRYVFIRAIFLVHIQTLLLLARSDRATIDVSLAVYSVVVILNFTLMDSWRFGTMFYSNGLHFINPGERFCPHSDATLVLALQGIVTGAHVFYDIRSSISWVIPAAATLTYVAFSAPSNMSPEGQGAVATQFSLLSLIGFCTWYGRYYQEQGDRVLWLSKRDGDHTVAIMSELLGVCFGCTARVGAGRTFLLDSLVEVEEVFGYRAASLDKMCASEEDTTRAAAFVEQLWTSSLPGKITLGFRGARGQGELVECNIYGVRDNAAVLLGFQVLDCLSLAEGEDSAPEGGDADAEALKSQDRVKVRIQSENMVPDDADEAASGRSSGLVSFHSGHLQADVISPSEVEVCLTGGGVARLVQEDIHQALRSRSYEIPRRALTVKGSLGAGSFGQVYKGAYRGSDVALKVIVPANTYSTLSQTRASEPLLRAARREIGILMGSRHRHLVVILGVVIEPSNLGLCIVFEHCPGGTVWHRVHDSKDLTVQAGMIVVGQVAEALAYLHQAEPQVIHRDVKAKNVLLSTRLLDDPIAKLGDFGASRLADSGSRTPGVGTTGWKAPEVYTHLSYDGAVDVYSLGIFLFEAVAMRGPFTDVIGDATGEAAKERVQAATREGWIPDVWLVEDRVKGLGGLLFQCLSFDPADRPSAQDVALTMKLLRPPESHILL